ncbi:MAG: aldehyde dehydrogenase family protein [Candidatus Aminicenantes bacterium]|nr:aldehyde dehydrogenase family protein [Candidatus Aminicenantes bacterium]
MSAGSGSPAPILINGSWRPARALETFTAFDPSSGRPLPGVYPVSSFADADEAVGAGRKAAGDLALVSSAVLADFFDLFARGILDRGDELVETAHRETALPAEQRLRTSELPRTTGQLHQAAESVRDGSWRQATIDTKFNIRSVREPLGGPVVVFGPNNFPFAFNASAGGDFAAALAAGNPVIAKGHPSHPGTTRLFAEIARDCLEETGLPRASVQLLYHLKPEDGLRLVAHPGIGATAFTGSRQAGLTLKQSADSAGRLIYLEMSSLNPVFLLPDAVRERGLEIAAELFSSCSLAAGQFCTKPGLTALLDNDDGRAFVSAVVKHFQSPPSGFLFSRNGREAVEAAVENIRRLGAELLAGGKLVLEPGYRFENTLFRISGERFLRNAGELQVEAFGTVLLLVCAESEDVLLHVAESLEGNLGIGIYSGSAGGRDEAIYDRLAPILRLKTGRLLNDKMPTGLAVVPSMVHGGPYPAAGHPGFTSVGIPPSFLRFTALRCYDNVRPDHLPPVLRDPNPTGRMWRLVDGEWTREDVP